jgi:hypothetical protein
MTPAREVIYAFRQFYDRYDGKRNPSLDIRSECFHINQAIIKFIEATIKLAETDLIKRNDIRILEMKNVPFALLQSKEKHNIYQVPDDYFVPLRRMIKAEKEGCGIKEFSPTVAQSDDLSYMLTNTYWKPNFGWEQSVCDEGKDGIYVWHNKDFTIKELNVDYYRKHIIFDCPSLADGGKYLRGGDTKMVTQDTYLELPDNTLSKIIQIADLLAQSNQSDERNLATRIKQITTA